MSTPIAGILEKIMSSVVARKRSQGWEHIDFVVY
jgi:hypothetical protein